MSKPTGRKNGRPSALDCPRLRFRNLTWLCLHKNMGMTTIEIAAGAGAAESTVRSGIKAALAVAAAELGG